MAENRPGHERVNLNTLVNEIRMPKNNVLCFKCKNVISQRQRSSSPPKTMCVNEIKLSYFMHYRVNVSSNLAPRLCLFLTTRMNNGKKALVECSSTIMRERKRTLPREAKISHDQPYISPHTKNSVEGKKMEWHCLYLKNNYLPAYLTPKCWVIYQLTSKNFLEIFKKNDFSVVYPISVDAIAPNLAGSFVIAGRTEWNPHCFCCFFCVVGYPLNWGKRPWYIDR